MKLKVIRAAQLDSAQAAIADAYEDIVSQLERQPEFAGAPDVSVRVILEASDGCRKWNVPENVLGFHGVSLEAANNVHEVHLNLDAGLRLISSAPVSDEREREIELAALLVTAPHALLHVVDWISGNLGVTSTKIFGGAGHGSGSHAGDTDSTEDKHEIEAREIVRRLMPDIVPAHARKVVDAMGSAPALAMS